MSAPPDPQRRSPRAAQAIVEAAEQLCRERGYGNVTIEAIAARAGVGKQTIYRWWPSKGVLLLDVFLQRLTKALAVEQEPGVWDELRARLRALVEELRRDNLGAHIAALVGATHVDEHLAEQLQARLAVPARRTHVELISQAQARGELRDDVAPDVVADLLFGPIWFRLLVTRQPLTLDFADTVVDSVRRGVGTEADGRLS